MTMTGSSRFLLAGLVAAAFVGHALAGGAAEPATSAAVGTKPWRKDIDCNWWLSGADGKSLRASIETGSDGVALTIADTAFMTWSETDRIKVELRFDRDPRRRVTTRGWVTRGDDYAMFGLYLNADALRKLAGANRLELRRGGKVAVEQALSETPGKAELLACLPGPSTGPSDSE